METFGEKVWNTNKVFNLLCYGIEHDGLEKTLELIKSCKSKTISKDITDDIYRGFVEMIRVIESANTALDALGIKEEL